MPRRKLGPTTYAAGGVALAALLGASPLRAWTPKPVANDPLVHMPGTQPAQGVVLEAPNKCLNCHDNYDPNVNIGTHWRGSMMAHAARDPIFWATFTVALQDSVWALGTPNAGDLCLRCHTPPGWLAGRSDPPNASALVTDDFDGVTCDSCHRMVDHRFEQTFAGTREGNDWAGYWDETNASAQKSSVEAQATRLADRGVVDPLTLFNGKPLYDKTSWQPVQSGWGENASGQYVMSPTNDKRASFADTNAKHGRLYSRYHKSRFMCASCHDVSNPVMANMAFASTPPGDGATVLPTEQQSAHGYAHVERTFSEFMLSDYGVGAGAFGSGAFDPAVFKTSRPGNLIATCQDCHMPDREGAGCDKAGTVFRPTGSLEHPKSGQPLHDLTGGNTLMPYILASTVLGSSNYDATNASLLRQGAAVLTVDYNLGQGLDAPALLAGAGRATQNLQKAASIEALTYAAATGALSFRVRNHTGHKLISGYPEGRRMFVTVRGYTGGAVTHTVNPYDNSAGTLKGLGTAGSPPLGPQETRVDALVYEAKLASSLTGEAHTFHFALATGRAKDNRIPPKGFRIAEAPARLSEPVVNGVSAPGYFTAAEYANGHDDVTLTLPAGLTGVEVSLYYQSTSREYIEFLASEINGTGTTLSSPTPSGEAKAYIAQTDPYFAKLKAWGNVISQLYTHNKAVPGAAPILMTQGVWGSVTDPCAQPGSNGAPCTDGDPCTQADACAAGVCVGTPLVCPVPDQCHAAGTCDPATGACVNPDKANGTACNDGDLCTTGDSCQAGVCTPGSAKTCAALDQCHLAGTCDPATGACSQPTKAPGSPCDDGNACTTADACSAGVCAGAPVVCTAADECHVAGTCAAGSCTQPLAADGTSCSSGTCQAGVCTPTGAGGSSGAGGSAGAAGSAGSGGAAAGAGGASGEGGAGASGSSGTGGAQGGEAGQGGQSAQGGEAGQGGQSAQGGEAGQGGQGGEAGQGGQSAQGGASGEAGAAGQGGSGQGGSGQGGSGQGGSGQGGSGQGGSGQGGVGQGGSAAGAGGATAQAGSSGSSAAGQGGGSGSSGASGAGAPSGGGSGQGGGAVAGQAGTAGSPPHPGAGGAAGHGGAATAGRGGSALAGGAGAKAGGDGKGGAGAKGGAPANGAGEPGGDAGSEDEAGCGCRVHPVAHARGLPWLTLALAAVRRRRRR